MWIEYPWPKNPVNTYTQKHWTVVSTIFGLISNELWQYGRPPLSQPIKLLMAIRIVWWFFLSLAGGILHSFTKTQNTQPSGWKKRRTNNRAWVSSKCKWGEVCNIFLLLFVHLQAIAGVYLRETSTKPLGMLT